MTSTLCGQPLSSLVGAASPFGNVIFLGYFDGPTSGAVQCQDDQATYAFEMIAVDDSGAYDQYAADEGEDLRIFSLAPLPLPAFERFARRLAEPDTLRHLPDNETLYQELESILGEAGPAEVVIATHGIRGSIVAARAIAAEDATRIQDWFAFLGIAPRQAGGGSV